MGKSTIYKWPFSIAMLVHQRVALEHEHLSLSRIIEGHLQGMWMDVEQLAVKVITTCLTHIKGAVEPKAIGKLKYLQYCLVSGL